MGFEDVFSSDGFMGESIVVSDVVASSVSLYESSAAEILNKNQLVLYPFETILFPVTKAHTN